MGVLIAQETLKSCTRHTIAVVWQGVHEWLSTFSNG